MLERLYEKLYQNFAVPFSCFTMNVNHISVNFIFQAKTMIMKHGLKINIIGDNWRDYFHILLFVIKILSISDSERDKKWQLTKFISGSEFENTA